MTTDSKDATYDLAGIGFLADDVVFAVGAAVRAQPLDEQDEKAIVHAALLLASLATLDDDDLDPAPSTGRLRELVSSRRHVIQAGRAGEAPSARVKEWLLGMSEKLRNLAEAPSVKPEAEFYRDVLDFFEDLGQVSLSEVRSATDGTQPAWMSSLPTGLL